MLILETNSFNKSIPDIRHIDFEVDGNWHAESEGSIDWSSLLCGTNYSQSIPCPSNAQKGQYHYESGIICDSTSMF